MHVIWDEFHIYYDANGAIIQPGQEIEMQTAWYKSGDINLLSNYTSSTFNSNSLFDDTDWTGWYLYRCEVDLWYYQNTNGSIKQWLSESEGANLGYKKYLKPKANAMYLGGTARPGEHLVLEAVWN